MNAEWKIFTDCQSENAASKAAARLVALIGLSLDSITAGPYHKGGLVISGTTTLSSEDWPQAILEALSRAQAVGRAWTITGDIADELDLWSNESVVPGVTSMHLQVARTEL